MASIPVGAQILTLDEALTYFSQWTPGDRVTARAWVEKTEVTDFYVPPSGGYIAGHGGRNRSSYRDMAVNGLLMHVGFLHAWPNEAEADGDERIELSNSRGSTSTSGGCRSTTPQTPARTCPHCFITVPRVVDECAQCGHDFAAARAANIARWRERQRRRSDEESASTT